MYHLHGAEKINTTKQPSLFSPSREIVRGRRDETRGRSERRVRNVSAIGNLKGAGGGGHSQEDDEGRAEGEEREHGGVGDQRRVHCNRRRRRSGSRGRLGAGGGRLGLRHGFRAILLGLRCVVRWEERSSSGLQ